jgi:nicotinamidase-related amidase
MVGRSQRRRGTVSSSLAPLGPETVHVVVDMQRLFAEDTSWRVPTLSDIVGPIVTLVDHRAERTLYTRFITPATLPAAQGAWQIFYRHWPQMTQDRLPPEIFNLIEPFASRASPAKLIDKQGFSAFSGSSFQAALRNLGAEALVLSGVETDVCVLATALEAADRRLRVVIASDAVASYSHAGHRAALDHIYKRYQPMIEVAISAEIIAAWQ